MRSFQHGDAGGRSGATIVTLPDSAPRRQLHHYIKILSAVRAERGLGGYDFCGKICRPGEAVPVEDPLAPLVALEAAIATIGRGHRRSEYLYILWRWDHEWIEVARTQSACGDWAWILGPPAARLLTAPPPSTAEVAGFVTESLKRLDEQVRRLDAESRRRFYAALHDELAERVVGG